MLRERIAELQARWAYLKYTIIDSRTPNPKLRRRSAPWPADEILFEESYTRISDPEAQVSELYEGALRWFQRSNEYNNGPLWAVRVYRSPTPGGREWLCSLADHVMLDGRGAVRLATALVAKDISELPAETDEFYEAIPSLSKGLPPVLVIIQEVFKAIIFPKLPTWISSWFGYVPTWPGVYQNKCIDSPWRTSLLSIPRDLADRFKAVAKSHGLRTLNPALYAVFCAAHWATFNSPLALQMTTLKDIRKPTDPYTAMGFFTFLVGTTPVGPHVDLWEVAQVYSRMCDAPGTLERGMNLIKMLELIPDGPFDPATSPPAPPNDRYPQGDKRAHTKAEAMVLRNINLMKPPQSGSGIWSNLAFMPLPDGADDMIFGVSASDTGGQPINCSTIGHEAGIRSEIAYLDGASMTREQVGRLHRNMRAIMEKVADGKGPWDFTTLSE